MNNHKQACELGETALSDALEKIDDVDEETFRDAKSIIELLKENLSLWKEEEEQNNVEDLWAQKLLGLMLSMFDVIWWDVKYPMYLNIVSCIKALIAIGTYSLLQK